nr:MAG TPA: hypothetical protein [Caudoviricetes sp.]
MKHNSVSNTEYPPTTTKEIRPHEMFCQVYSAHRC